MNSDGRGARVFPAALSGWHHLECQLDDSDAVDLILQVEARGPTMLLSHVSAASPRGGAWHDVGLLARECGEDALLSNALPRLWLEFDLQTSADASTHLPVPSVFAELTPAGVRGVIPKQHDTRTTSPPYSRRSSRGRWTRLRHLSA